MNRADLRNPYPSFSCAPVRRVVAVRAPSRLPALIRSVAAFAAIAAALAYLIP